MTRNKGFTLIELMIVVAILAVIAAIALPNLLSARQGANETAAIATLRELHSAQTILQKRGAIDVDGDGSGEMGTLAELSGKVPVRGGAVLTPQILSAAFRTVNGSGEVALDGYQYRVFLPDAAGLGQGELPGGGPSAAVDPDVAELAWCAYAWPSNYEQTGVRTFFVNQRGEILFASRSSYSGPGTGPPAGAAFRGTGSVDSITGIVATGTTGRDGSLWKMTGN